MTRRKRSHDEFSENRQKQEDRSNLIGVGQTLSLLKAPIVEPFIFADAADTGVEENGVDNNKEWQTKENNSLKKQKKIPKKDSPNYPSIIHAAHARLQTHVTVNSLQGLVLYILGDGTAPQWCAVRHYNSIRKVVVLMVPGLEHGVFDGSISLEDTDKNGHAERAGSPLNAHSDAPSRDNVVNGSLRNEQLSKDPADGERHTPNALPQSKGENRIKLAPDDYYPVRLLPHKLSPTLRPLADIFPHIWPVKAPGDDKYSRLHSPLQAMLSVPLTNKNQEKHGASSQPAKLGKDWEGEETPLPKYIATAEELQENGYVMHPSLLTTSEDVEAELKKRAAAGRLPEDGWVDSPGGSSPGDPPVAPLPSGDRLTGGRPVLALDCEMCKTAPGDFALTRISVVAWNGRVIMDELVKPAKPITDYVTAYSGITAAMLDKVTTTLSDVQQKFLSLLTPDTILIGHSLDSDLRALRLTHAHIVDTALLYPHPRGPPLKSSLKWLSQQYLSREIQKGGNIAGHDSVEDARACLDLVKVKCEKGPKWGSSQASVESIFKRLTRSRRPQRSKTTPGADEPRTGAVVDWGDPSRGIGGTANVCIGCAHDGQVVEGVKRAVRGDVNGHLVPPGGVDFVFARLRELEAVRGWWNRTSTIDNTFLHSLSSPVTTLPSSSSSSSANLTHTLTTTIARIHDIYESLPPCTALIVFSGTGDPRDLGRMQDLQAKFKREYKEKKWDELSVKWTDVEEQELKRAVRKARRGLAFVAVK